MEIKIAADVAGADIGRWFDFKRIKPIKREIFGQHVNTLVQAVMYGDIEIKADCTIVHNLNFPITDKDGAVLFDKLEYAPRMSAQKVSECLSGTDTQNEVSNSLAFGSALTGQAMGVLGKMDSSDLSILTAITVFFT